MKRIIIIFHFLFFNKARQCPPTKLYLFKSIKREKGNYKNLKKTQRIMNHKTKIKKIYQINITRRNKSNYDLLINNHSLSNEPKCPLEVYSKYYNCHNSKKRGKWQVLLTPLIKALTLNFWFIHLKKHIHVWCLESFIFLFCLKIIDLNIILFLEYPCYLQLIFNSEF